MRDITLVMAYYENPGMLRWQYYWLEEMHAEVRKHLHLVIVDDGSPKDPAFKPLSGMGLASIQMFRMKVDVPWNQDACRNLGVKHARTQWVLLTDIDHLVPQATLLSLLKCDLNEDIVYQFERETCVSREPFVAKPYKHHPNTWLMARMMYRLIGGYDERFAGYYGTDGDFRDRVKGVAEVIRRPEPIIRVPREVVPDASTTTLERKSDENADMIAKIKASRRQEAPWRPLNGIFAWEEVK